MSHRWWLGTLVLSLALSAGLGAQRSMARQIEDAVNPLPQGERAGARVLGYRPGQSTLTVIREGTNHFVCLADRPGDDRFQVSCYHRALEPFMARGRALRAEGLNRHEVMERRNREIEEGRLPMVSAMLISLFGRINPATGRPDSVNTLRVLYLPGATPEETGLSTSGRGGIPWLMNPGTPRAHLMIPGERRRFPED